MCKRISYKRLLWIDGDLTVKYRHSRAKGLEWFDQGRWKESSYLDLEELRRDASRHPEVVLKEGGA